MANIEHKAPDVPYIVHEAEVARQERNIKRLWIAIIILIVAIVLSNAMWINAWTQYDYASESVTVDGKDGGNVNYVGGNGDINNGESGSKTEDTD